MVDLDAGVIRDVSEALEALPPQRYPLPKHDLLMASLPKVVSLARKLAPKARKVSLGRAALLAPVANPGKIIGAPANYAKHIEEAKADAALHRGKNLEGTVIAKWGFFLKAGSSLVGPSQGVTLRRPLSHMENRIDHELELVAIIGKRGTRISRTNALKHVSAYAIGLDMSLRSTHLLSFRKSIDTYAVLGPWLVTADEFGDPGSKDLKLWVNGKLRQDANTQDMIYDLPGLIEYASSFYTLEPGDLIYTGTPEGVGPVVEGDVMTCEIAGIGQMTVAIN